MHQQFQLEEQVATLLHINPRPEKHGEENVPAADLKIEVTESNELLSMFHPTLRSMLYKATEVEGLIDGVEPPLTTLRFGSLIERLRLGFSLKGADVLIDFGLGGSSAIELDTVDVDSFNLTLMDGGSVSLIFRVKARPTGDQIKKLYEVMGREITISVTPAIEKQGSLGLPVEAEA